DPLQQDHVHLAKVVGVREPIVLRQPRQLYRQADGAALPQGVDQLPEELAEPEGAAIEVARGVRLAEPDGGRLVPGVQVDEGDVEVRRSQSRSRSQSQSVRSLTGTGIGIGTGIPAAHTARATPKG